MEALRRQEKEIIAEDVCNGSIGTSACGRALKVLGTATYRS
jgi:hypothetical protein